MSAGIEETMLAMLAALAPGKSAAPDDIAKAVDPENWRRRLGQVRGIAIGLARQKKLVILRHNRVADPETFKGVYRLRLPAEGD